MGIWVILLSGITNSEALNKKNSKGLMLKDWQRNVVLP